MPFEHQSIAQELLAIRLAGEYGQKISDAINNVGLGFWSQQDLNSHPLAKNPDIKINAIFFFDPDPNKRSIILNGDIFKKWDNSLIIVEDLAHEGIHALQAFERPEAFDVNSPNAELNEVDLERQARVDSIDITLRNALWIAAASPGDFAVNLVEAPLIRAWTERNVVAKEMIATFLAGACAGRSAKDMLKFIHDMNTKIFDQTYRTTKQQISELSGQLINCPERPTVTDQTVKDKIHLKDGPI